ncbi:MAG: methyltransferase domain-containing protein [Chromatiaceae bacterium]|nr:methyltransferase domain-containing protein [Chromatiaceae bacterium]MCP5314073.1 methyltransferase domain-containing protein [Chromatiaceae bacterium]
MPDSGDRQRDWEGRYQAGQTGWDRGQVSPALMHWLASETPPRGRVLVPGCGHGHEVAELIRSGCQVTAVDIAASPVLRLMGQLAERGLHANVVQADLLHWEPAEPFDAIYEQTCLCALDPAHWRDYERRLAGWLPPGGILYALFMQTGRAGGPPFDCPLPDMRTLFAATRWLWPDADPLRVPHPTGLNEIGYMLVRR